jgi:hypothetical protein
VQEKKKLPKTLVLPKPGSPPPLLFRPSRQTQWRPRGGDRDHERQPEYDR